MNQSVLAAARLMGVERVFRVGGAQAIAAMAYGTETIPRVDVICGPGNAYVMEAKRQVYGSVGIDNLAGPSEVLIVADRTARPDWVAADLLAQEEHGSGATAVLMAESEELCARSRRRWTRCGRGRLARGAAAWQASGTRRRAGRPMARRTGDSRLAAFYPAPGEDFLAVAEALVNAYAPEHLEIQLADRPGLPAPGAIGRGCVRRPPRPYRFRGLRRRQQPRAPHRGFGSLLVAALGAHLHAQLVARGDDRARRCGSSPRIWPRSPTARASTSTGSRRSCGTELPADGPGSVARAADVSGPAEVGDAPRSQRRPWSCPAAPPLCAILRRCPGPAFAGLAAVTTAPGILLSPTTGGEAVQPPSSAPTSGSLPRVATSERKTRETNITVRLDLDGSGRAAIDTGLGFFDHMLELVAGHGLFDLEVRAAGDLHTGGHHTVEDVGICLGQALAEAVGDKRGINRYGSTFVPMDEALALVALDLSGRPFFAYEGGPVAESIGGFDAGLVAEFFRALANNARFDHARARARGR